MYETDLQTCVICFQTVLYPGLCCSVVPNTYFIHFIQMRLNIILSKLKLSSFAYVIFPVCRFNVWCHLRDDGPRPL